jgi:hypothetical protein
VKLVFAGVLGGLQGLGSDESRERPVDRLAALGAIQNAQVVQAERTSVLCALGVRLISFKYANCPTSKADAEDMLCAVLAWTKKKNANQWGLKLNAGERTIIAAQALMEYAIDFCPTCKSGEIPDQSEREGAQPMKTCPSCSGTGRRRYSDEERAEAMGRTFAKAMQEAHSILSRAESLAVSQAKQMLERF